MNALHHPVAPPAAPAPRLDALASTSTPGSGGSLPRAVVAHAATAHRVMNTTDYPWRVVCSLEIFAPSGKKDWGTAWFAGPRTLITAGHCLYAEDYGTKGAPAWASKVRVTPARNGSGAPPYGSFDAASFESVAGWVDSVNAGSPEPRYDYGMIALGSDAVGTKLGWFAVQALSDAALTASPAAARIIGYPLLTNVADEMWAHDDAIASVDAARLYYHADTRAGESGGPVLMNVEGSLCAVGIHCERQTSGSAATRITADIVATIEGWLARNA